MAQITWSISMPGIVLARASSCRVMAGFPSLDTLVLDPHFNGPPGTAAGGYACGAIGELVDGPAEVTLRTPPPLGVPLGVGFLPGGESIDGAS